MKKCAFLLYFLPVVLYAPALMFSPQDPDFALWSSHAGWYSEETYSLILDLQTSINTVRRKNQLPPVSRTFVVKFVIAWIQQESGFRLKAESVIGCYGLLQICPDVWKLDKWTLEDPYINLQNGFQIFLHYLEESHGYISKALLLYNNGYIIRNETYDDSIFNRIKKL